MVDTEVEALHKVIRQKDETISVCNKTMEKYYGDLKLEHDLRNMYKNMYDRDIVKSRVEEYDKVEDENRRLKLVNERLENEKNWCEKRMERWRYRISDLFTESPVMVISIAVACLLLGLFTGLSI